MGEKKKSGRPKKKNKVEMPQKPLLLRIMSHDIDLSPASKLHGELMRKANEGLLGKNGYRNKLEEIRKLQKDLEGEYEQKMHEYHKSLSPFECTLNEAQMELLLTFFNEHLLEEPISLEELEDIFMGKDRRLTYRLKNWDLLILLFKGLAGEGFDDTDDKTITYLSTCFKPIEDHPYICKCWQKAIEDLEEFTDKKGIPLTSGKIRRRLSEIKNLPKVKIPIDALERFFEQLVKLEV